MTRIPTLKPKVGAIALNESNELGLITVQNPVLVSGHANWLGKHVTEKTGRWLADEPRVVCYLEHLLVSITEDDIEWAKQVYRAHGFYVEYLGTCLFKVMMNDEICTFRIAPLFVQDARELQASKPQDLTEKAVERAQQSRKRVRKQRSDKGVKRGTRNKSSNAVRRTPKRGKSSTTK